jgi:hypothetical protein
LDLSSSPAPSGDATRGWELLRDAARDGVPAAARPGTGRRRSPAARAGLVLRLPGALVRRRSVRVVCTGSAAELAADLRVLAIDVIHLDHPGRGGYLRAVLRGAVENAVVVVEGRGRPFPPATLVAGPTVGRPELLRQVLRQLTTG